MAGYGPWPRLRRLRKDSLSKSLPERPWHRPCETRFGQFFAHTSRTRTGNPAFLIPFRSPLHIHLPPLAMPSPRTYFDNRLLTSALLFRASAKTPSGPRGSGSYKSCGTRRSSSYWSMSILRNAVSMLVGIELGWETIDNVGDMTNAVCEEQPRHRALLECDQVEGRTITLTGTTGTVLRSCWTYLISLRDTDCTRSLLCWV